MLLRAGVLSHPKRGNSADENEDAHCLKSIQADIEFAHPFVCAVADGATETSYSSLWANLLVETFVECRGDACQLGANVRLEHHFKSCPEVAAKERLDQEIFIRAEDLSGKRKRLEQSNATIGDRETRREGLSAKLQADTANITTEQGTEMRKVYEQQAVTKSQIEAKRRALGEEEARALRTATERLGHEARNIQSQIAALSHKRTQMLAEALVQLRTTMLNNFLSQHSVSGEQFYGVSYRFKQNLIYEGIRTAADVSYGRVSRVEGFGPKRTATIISWRQNFESHYTGRLPATLPQAEAQRVEQAFEVKRNELDAIFRLAKQKTADAQRQVESAFSNRKSVLAGEENQNSASTQQRIASINAIRENKITYLRNRFESTKRELEREITTSQALVRSLQADITRTEIWLLEVAKPTKAAYKLVTFERFVFSVITSKYRS